MCTRLIKKNMKYLKNVLISFLTALITIVFIYGGYSTFAEEDDQASFWTDFEDADYFWTAKYKYHGAMNDYFNKKFKALYEFLEEDKDFFKPESKGRKLLTPPPDEELNKCEEHKSDCSDEKDNDGDGKTDKEDPQCKDEDGKYDRYLNEKHAEKDNLSCLREKCGEENLSTYCVSLGALNIHLRYLNKLDALQEALPDTNDVDCFHRETIPIIGAYPSCANVASLENLAGFSKERNEAIIDEYDSSRKIMEGAVGAYNEFMLAYPMHKKYEAILEELSKYKKALRAIKYEVMVFPLKFIGTSSYVCS